MTGEELKNLRKENGITQEELSKATGIPKGTIGRIEFNKDEAVKKVDVLQTLSNFFKKESIVGHKNPIMNHKEEQKRQIPIDFMEKIRLLLNAGSTVQLTPVYNQHVTAEPVSRITERETIPDVILLNSGFKDCDIVIRHTDPAMDGFVGNKSFIGLKRISKDSFTKRIIPGKAYVIVMDDYVIERFVHPGTNGSFLLKSENPIKGPEFEIETSEIVELWLIKIWIPVFEAEPV